jgi:hypothetical protein
MLWNHTLDLARGLAFGALTLDEPFVAGTRSWTEVPFGDPRANATPQLPWDPCETIAFPGSPFVIRGRIDRIELDLGDARARLTDYKTGVPPKQPDRVVLDGGRELQRVLYSAAVRHHRADARILARLVYLREEPTIPNRRLSGEALDSAIEVAAGVFNQAADLVRNGVTLPGPDGEEAWNPYRLALPAQGEPYLRTKRAAFSTAFGEFDRIWRTP